MNSELPLDLPKAIDIEVKELDLSSFDIPQLPPIAKSPLSTFIEQIDGEMNTLRLENEKLKIANNSLMETMGTLERAFDVAWSECFGPETFAFLKQHFRSRLGL